MSEAREPVLDQYTIDVHGVPVPVTILPGKYVLREPEPPSGVPVRRILERLRKLRQGLAALRDPALRYYVVKEAGFGELEPLLHDPELEDIHVIGEEVVVEHARYGLLHVNIRVRDPERLVERLAMAAGECVSYAAPYRRFALCHEGTRFRVSVMLAPEAAARTCVTIRRLRFDEFSPPRLVAEGSVDPVTCALCALMVNLRRTCLIVGPPSSGKTTLLVSTLSFAARAKVLLVQHADELWLPEGVLVFESLRVDPARGFSLLRQLNIAILERSPHVVAIDDLQFDRGGLEPWAFLQFGRAKCGVLATMHGESPLRALERFLIPPVNARVQDLLDAVDLVLVMSYDRSAHRRVLTAAYLVDSGRLLCVVRRWGGDYLVAHPEAIAMTEPVRSALEHASFLQVQLDDEAKAAEFVEIVAKLMSRLACLAPRLTLAEFAALWSRLIPDNYERLRRRLSGEPLRLNIMKPCYVDLRLGEGGLHVAARD